MFGNTQQFSMHRTMFVMSIVFLAAVSSANGYDCVKRPKVRYPYCQDRFEARKGHTMCLGTIRQHNINDTVRRELEDLHNNVRVGVSPPAANMIKLQINKLLEKEAQLWAEQCTMSHDRADLRFLADRFTVGQNIAIGGPVINWTDVVVNQWGQENTTFTYGGPNNESLVRNYVQMIWGTTILFGCGVSKCGPKHFYVCNYASSMDENKIDTPYQPSRTGSSCDSCVKNCDNVTSSLCDCKGKLCLNGGSLDFATCTCNCITEVNAYDPEFCDLRCNPNGDDPKCGSTPYERSSCLNTTDTVFHCPWMCDICPYADKTYRESSELLPWERGLPMCTTTTSSTTPASTTSTFTSSPSATSIYSIAPVSVSTSAMSSQSPTSPSHSLSAKMGQHNVARFNDPNCHVIGVLVILPLYLINAF